MARQSVDSKTETGENGTELTVLQSRFKRLTSISAFPYIDEKSVSGSEAPLPIDVIRIILSYGSPTYPKVHETIASHSCAFFGNFLAVDALAKYIACGDHDAVEAMTKANPQLLLCEMDVDTYATDVEESPLQIVGTAYQAALALQDRRMVSMLAKLLDNHHPGEEEKQLALQFHPGIEEKALQRHDTWVQTLNHLVYTLQQVSSQAVSNAKTVDYLERYSWPVGKLRDEKECVPLLKALNDFRALFTPRPILNGTTFDLQLLIDAIQLVKDPKKFNQDRDDIKRRFFEGYVLGYLQRFMPPWLVQAVAQGCYFIVEKNEKLIRSNVCPLEPIWGYGPQDAPPVLGLGQSNCGSLGDISYADYCKKMNKPERDWRFDQDYSRFVHSSKNDWQYLQRFCETELRLMQEFIQKRAKPGCLTM